MIEVNLPWPPNELSPNFRGHWAVISRAKKTYRSAARTLTLKALWRVTGFERAQEIRLAYVFCPPMARSYDRDNLAARMKAATDGIADALCMNDRGFHFAPAQIGEKVKGGMVRLTIEPLGER